MSVRCWLLFQCLFIEKHVFIALIFMYLLTYIRLLGLRRLFSFLCLMPLSRLGSPVCLLALTKQD